MRRGVWVFGGLLVLILGLFVYSTTDNYRRNEAAMWNGASMSSLAQNMGTDATAHSLDSLRGVVGHGKLDGPPWLQAAARQWEAAVEQYNPGAVVLVSPDNRGNLVVIVGPWWQRADNKTRLAAINGMGVAWRIYLRKVVSQAQIPWPDERMFTPSVTFGDGKRTVGWNMRGKVVCTACAGRVD